LLGELQKRNLKVHISEFDVNRFGGSNGALDHTITDLAIIDPFVAGFARPYIRDVRSFSNVKATICWDRPTSIRISCRINSAPAAVRRQHAAETARD
jgi:hypothetical protein